jgi:hypothetical protein
LADVEVDIEQMVAALKKNAKQDQAKLQDADIILESINEGEEDTDPDAGSAKPEGTPLEFLELGENFYYPGDFVYITNPENPKVHTIAQLHNIWTGSDGKKGVTVCWFIRPDQTKFKFMMSFYEKEVFKTNHYENYSDSEIAGKCYVLHKNEYISHKPEEGSEEDSFVCESLYNIETGEVIRIKDWAAHLPQIENTRDVPVVKRNKPIALTKRKLPAIQRQQVPMPSPSKRKREFSEDSERILPKRRATLNVSYDSPTPAIKTISVAPAVRSTRSAEKPQFHLPGPPDTLELTKKQSIDS